MAEIPETVHPLIAEALRKLALAWVEVPGERARAVWVIAHEDAVYLVHGGGEQPLPGLAGAAGATVTARSADNGARVATFRAAASTVEPGSEEWQDVVPLLLAKRLNLPDPETAETRWAAGSVVTRLTPVGEPLPEPQHSLAAEPPPTPATTEVRVPKTFHKKPRRRVI